jgi:hypothetical protein
MTLIDIQRLSGKQNKLFPSGADIKCILFTIYIVAVIALGTRLLLHSIQARSQSMPVRGVGSAMPLPNPRTGIFWERDGTQFTILDNSHASSLEIVFQILHYGNSMQEPFCDFKMVEF